MKTALTNWKNARSASHVMHAVITTMGDVMLCAATGALYGMVIGGFGPQARNELTMHGFLAMGGLGALVGLVLGIAVGVHHEMNGSRNQQEQRDQPGVPGTGKTRPSPAIPTTRIRNVLKKSLPAISGQARSGMSTITR